MLTATTPTPALADAIEDIRLLAEHLRATRRQRGHIFDAARMMVLRGHTLAYARRWLADATAELDHDYDLARAQRTGKFA